jgi:hypothetical protein
MRLEWLHLLRACFACAAFLTMNEPAVVHAQDHGTTQQGRSAPLKSTVSSKPISKIDVEKELRKRYPLASYPDADQTLILETAYWLMSDGQADKPGPGLDFPATLAKIQFYFDKPPKLSTPYRLTLIQYLYKRLRDNPFNPMPPDETNPFLSPKDCLSTFPVPGAIHRLGLHEKTVMPDQQDSALVECGLRVRR